jgi:hypothetical protein
MGVSPRQISRLLDRYREGGIESLVHLSVGKPGHHQIPEKIKQEALGIFKDQYPDAGPVLFAELLAENHGISISTETSRRWLNSDGARII